MPKPDRGALRRCGTLALALTLVVAACTDDKTPLIERINAYRTA